MLVKKDGSLSRFFFDDILMDARDIFEDIDIGNKPNLGDFVDVFSKHPAIQRLSKMLGQSEHEQRSFFMTMFTTAWVWETGKIVHCSPDIQYDLWGKMPAQEALCQEKAILLLNPPGDLIMANGAKVEGVALVSSPFRRIAIEKPRKASDMWVPTENNDHTLLTMTFGSDAKGALCVSYQFYMAGNFPIEVELDNYIQSVTQRYAPEVLQAQMQNDEQKATQIQNLIDSTQKNQIPFGWACQMLAAKRAGFVVEEQVGRRVKSHKLPALKKNKSNVKMYFKWERSC